MHPAGPWNEGGGGEISWEMPLAHRPAGLDWLRKAEESWRVQDPGQETPTFLT